jgi:hypothetical protein
LEVIGWWLGLGLLTLLLISSKLVDRVHSVELIIEEYIRFYRWASIEAGMGLGEGVFEVLLLSCWPIELVCVGFGVILACGRAFLHLRSWVRLWVDVKPICARLASHICDLKSLWRLNSTLSLHRLHSVLEAGVHCLGQAALCTVEASSRSACSKSQSISILQRLLRWRVTLMKPSSSRICRRAKFLVHAKLPLAGSKEATVGIQPPRCLRSLLWRHTHLDHFILQVLVGCY